MANNEGANTLLSNSNVSFLDLLGIGTISGFPYKSATFGADPLLSTYYDDVPIRNLDGSYNYNISGSGFAFNWTQGTAMQTGIPGFQRVETIIPLSPNTRIANPAPGQGSYKTVNATFNSVMFSDANSIKVTVRVPALFSQDDEGNTNGFEISYAIDISVNNGPFVEQEVVTIRGKCTQPYLKSRSYTLPKTIPATSYYEWKVRVRRTSVNILSMKTQNEIYVDSISVISSSLFAYPNSVLVGQTIGADQFATIPTRSFEVCGLLMSAPSGYTPTSYLDNVPTSFTRQCDVEISNRHVGMTTQTATQMLNITAGSTVAGAGIPAGASIVSIHDTDGVYFFTLDVDPTATNNNTTLSFTSATVSNQVIAASYPDVWLGNFVTGVWTDNPAWIYYDLLTNPVHGLGDFIQTGSVDKWGLYQIAQYCDQMVDNGAGGLEPRFTCNVVISQPEQAYNVLLNLASTFRGMLYFGNGTVHATQTSHKIPGYIFNNSNVIDGVFSYSDTSANTRSTVAKVKWTDPSNQYRDNIEYIEDLDGIRKYGYQVKEMTAFACTSKGQAYRLGSWALQTEQLLTETVTFQTSLEGNYVTPGEAFGVYDNFRNNKSQAGRIASFNAGRSQIFMDRPVVLDPGVTYSLTAIIPKPVYNAPNDITGSDQIPLITNSQIESFRVTSSAGTNSSLIVAGQFSTGIYVGSPWVLSSSGDPTGIFRQATFYTCLATAEISPGKVEVLGLQANSGINFVISTGYTVVDNPPNGGDSSSIQPPTNLNATWLTGALNDNTYYSNILLNWTPTPSTNLAYYDFSGKTFGFNYSGHRVVANSYSWPQLATGKYDFSVAAVSLGGVKSTYATTNITIQAANPFGKRNPLSGVFIYQDADPTLLNAAGFSTGFIGTRPGLEWNIAQDTRGYDVPWIDLITGYRLRMSGLDGGDLLSQGAIYIKGVENTQYLYPENFLYTGFVGGAQRGINFVVEPMDKFGGYTSGVSLKINNPVPHPPLGSGLAGFGGGMYYNLTPNTLDYDISGVYIWANPSPSFVPTLSNKVYSSENLAGIFYNSNANSDPFYTWISLIDTYGQTGSTIYGPVSLSIFDLVTGVNYSVIQTGKNLSAWVTNISTSTTGVNARVDIVAAAYSTGWALDPIHGGYTGGAAIATWGFKLDAGGKVASLKASASSFPDVNGTIILGNMDMTSSTYTAGSLGWKVGFDGNAEFNSVTVRGQVFYRSGQVDSVLMGGTSNGRGVLVGSMGGSRFFINGEDGGGGIPIVTISRYNNTVAFADFVLRDDTVGGVGGSEIAMYGSDLNASKIRIRSPNGSISGRQLMAGPNFNAYGGAVDITGVNLRIYDIFGNQASRISNTDGQHFISGVRVLRSRFPSGVPTTLQDVINIVQWHGFSD